MFFDMVYFLLTMKIYSFWLHAVQHLYVISLAIVSLNVEYGSHSLHCGCRGDSYITGVISGNRFYLIFVFGDMIMPAVGLYPIPRCSEGLLWCPSNCNKWTLVPIRHAHSQRPPLMIDNVFHSCEILGSHGGEYEDDCLLGCCAV
jgi:hypothetical protein